MQPVDQRPQVRLLQIEETLDTHEQHTRQQQHETREEQCVPDTHRAAVPPPPGRSHVYEAENQKRNNDEEANGQVQHEHNEVEVVLVNQPLPPPPADPLQKRDAGQINRIGRRHRHQGQNAIEQNAQPRTDGSDRLPLFGVSGLR